MNSEWRTLLGVHSGNLRYEWISPGRGGINPLEKRGRGLAGPEAVGKAAVKGRAGPLAESSWCGAEEAGRVQEGREEGLEMWLGTQLEWDGVGIKVPFVNLTSALMRGGLPVWLRV